MKKQKFISIIVPIFNSEKYLTECLDSIQKQSYSYFEVIMIDDGSTDCSSVIARQYLKDNRFKYFYKENGGISSVRNYGIELSCGEYIAFVDSDDYIDKDYLLCLVNGIGSSDLCICYYTTLEINGELHKPVNMDIASFKPEEIWNIKTMWLKMIDVPWNKLYRKELFSNIRYPVGHIHEDSLVIDNILSNCKWISLINYSLYTYRQHESSIMYLAKKGNSLEKFNVYFANLHRFAVSNNKQMFFDTYLALMVDVMTFKTKTNIYNENKLQIDNIISKIKKYKRKAISMKPNYKTRLQIYLFCFNPNSFYIFRKVMHRKYNKDR